MSGRFESLRRKIKEKQKSRKLKSKSLKKTLMKKVRKAVKKSPRGQWQVLINEGYSRGRDRERDAGAGAGIGIGRSGFTHTSVTPVINIPAQPQPPMMPIFPPGFGVPAPPPLAPLAPPPPPPPLPVPPVVPVPAPVAPPAPLPPAPPLPPKAPPLVLPAPWRGVGPPGPPGGGGGGGGGLGGAGPAGGMPGPGPPPGGAAAAIIPPHILAAHQKEIEDLKDDARKRLKQADDHAKDLAGHIGARDADLARIRGERNDLVSNSQVLGAELKRARADAIDLTQEIAKLAQEKKDIQKRHNDLIAAGGKGSASEKALQIELDAAKQREHDAGDELMKARRDYGILKDRHDVYETEVARSKQAYQDLVQNHRVQVQKYEDDAATARKQYDHIRSGFDGANSIAQQQAALYNDSLRTIDQLSRDIQALQADLAAEKARDPGGLAVQQIKAELDQAKAELANAKQEVAQHKAEADHHRTQAQIAQDELDTSKREFQGLQQTHAGLLEDHSKEIVEKNLALERVGTASLAGVERLTYDQTDRENRLANARGIAYKPQEEYVKKLAKNADYLYPEARLMLAKNHILDRPTLKKLIQRTDNPTTDVHERDFLTLTGLSIDDRRKGITQHIATRLLEGPKMPRQIDQTIQPTSPTSRTAEIVDAGSGGGGMLARLGAYMAPKKKALPPPSKSTASSPYSMALFKGNADIPDFSLPPSQSVSSSSSTTTTSTSTALVPASSAVVRVGAPVGTPERVNPYDVQYGSPDQGQGQVVPFTFAAPYPTPGSKSDQLGAPPASGPPQSWGQVARYGPVTFSSRKGRQPTAPQTPQKSQTGSKFGSGAAQVDSLKKNGLSDADLLTLVKKTGGNTAKYFRGVFSRDELPKVNLPVSMPSSMIINTDPSTKSGEHWVAMYIDPRPNSLSAEYFDSLGHEPSPAMNQTITEMLKFNFSDLKSMLKFKVNGVKTQNATSPNCGFFALKFITQRSNGKSFASASGFTKCIPHGQTARGETSIRVIKRKFGYV